MGCQKPAAHTQQKLTQVPSPPPSGYTGHILHGLIGLNFISLLFLVTQYMYNHVLIFFFIPLSLAKSQHYSDGLIEIFTQYGDHLYR